MYEYLTDDIWKELGPVDPDWFQVLTARASSREENLSDPEELCPNQEGNAKTLGDAVAATAESQHFSTPKVFRRRYRYVTSPAAEDRPREMEASPWSARSPCLFPISRDAAPSSNDGSVRSRDPDAFGLLHTPLKSPASYAQHISESLGANLHPDISWSSSLNTPSALPPTIILSNREDSPRPGTFSLSGTVLMVRKLFPSLSNANQNEAESNDLPVALQDSPEAGHSSENSPKLPDAAIEDGENRNGTENLPSVSLTDTDLELKKAKTSEEGESAQERGVKRPVEAEATQWSPLSFSDIPPTAAYVNQCKTQKENQPIPAQTVTPAFKSSGLTKKKVQFIYTVDKEKRSLKTDSTQGHEPPTSDDKSSSCDVGDGKEELRESVTQEKPTPSLQPDTRDLDMSQLCRAFAQDFSQMSEPSKARGFSPSARLTALKVAQQKTKKHSGAQSEAPRDVEVTASDSGFLSAGADISRVTAFYCQKPSHRWALQTTSTVQNEACLEEVSLGTPADAEDTSVQLPKEVSHHPVLQLDENTVESVAFCSFKTASDKAPQASAAHLQKSTGDQQPDNMVLPTTTSCLVTVSKKCLSKENRRCTEESLEGLSSSIKKVEKAPKYPGNTSSSARRDNRPAISDGVADKEIPEMSSFVWSRPIKAPNEDPLKKESLQGAVKNASESPGNTNTVTCNNIAQKRFATTSTLALLGRNCDNCPLSASQKADVKELCTLLEEAGSQFEFTQFKTTKLNPLDEENSASAKELDPGFLSGIDFDDSFCAETDEKVYPLLQDGTKLQVPDVVREPPSARTIEKEITVAEETSEKSVGVSKKCLKKTKHLFQDLKESVPTQRPNPEKGRPVLCESISQGNSYNAKSPLANVASFSSSSNLVSIYGRTGARFCPADGKSSSVSAEVTAKAEHLLREDERVKRGSFSEIRHVDRRPGGFQTAAGKHVAVSLAALTKAKSLLDECVKVTEYPDGYTSPEKSETRSVNGKPATLSFDSPVDNLGSASESVVSFAKQGNVSNPSLGSAFSFLSGGGGVSPATGKKVMEKTRPEILPEDHQDDRFSEMKDGSFSAVQRIGGQSGGFQTAGGKRLAVSSAALRRAKFLLDDCDAREFLSDTGKSVSAKSENADFKNTAFLESKNIRHRRTQENYELDFSSSGGGGFHTASGKKVSVSAAGLAKAKHLLQEDHQDNSSREKRNVEPLSAPSVVNTGSRVNLSLDVGSSVLSVGGFSTASGKKVAVSAAAVAKAKRLLQEDQKDDSSIIDAGSHANQSSDVGSSVLSVGGFSTASGKKVAVSAAAVAKAKRLLQDDHNDDSSREERNVEPPSVPSVVNTGSRANSSLDVGSSVPSVGGFSTASGKKVAVSAAALAKAKRLLQEDHKDNTENHSNSSLSVGGSSLIGGEFTTDSGKKVAVSPVSRHLLQDDHETDSSKNMKHGSFSGVERIDYRAGVSQTAGGKRVSVSSAALTKAKSLFDECCSREGNRANNAPSRKSAYLSEMEDPGSFSAQSLNDNVNFTLESLGLKKYDAQGNARNQENGCFSTAVAENDHFKDTMDSHVGMFEQDPEMRHQLKADVKFGNMNAAQFMDNDGTEHLQNLKKRDICSFSLRGRAFCTASGKSVSVSEEAITRAKSLFNDVEGDEHNIQNVGLQSARRIPTSEAREKAKSFFSECQEERADVPHTSTPCSSSFSAASGKRVLVSDDAMARAISLFDESIVRERRSAASEGSAREGEEMLEELDGEIIKTPEQPSVVNFQSLDLMNCTETQQLFLAQEALDCTKALLQDEGLTGPSMTFENMLRQNDSNETPGLQIHGKRLAEDKDLNDQPPLKRRLLDEFDRSLDSPGGSKLCPQISSPNGLVKDRPVFNHVSLGPNVTKPHRDGYLEGAASPRRTPQARLAGLTSVPRFFKKTEVRPRNSTTKPPLAFVPPFKRGRTAVERSFNSDSISGASLKTASDHPATGHDSDRRPSPDPDRSRGAALENVELAQDMQDMRIRKKKRQTIKPLPGSLFRTKTSGEMRISFKDAVRGRTPGRFTQKQLYDYGVHRHVCDITSETAEAFRFRLELFFKTEAFADESGIRLADGGYLVPSGDGTAGKEQFFRALCDTPGVDPKLLSDVWVYNHYRWIVWKLASMERSFPETLGGLCLTPERVLLQLKYRYDVEVDRSRRPALRKILEKDDTATRTLVLCVCGVVSPGQTENPRAVVRMTDGWYAVKAQLDEPLTARLREGRLAVGGKLVISGAQLVGSQDGCAPLEAPESLVLKIFANGSRPARWDAKLGFYKDPRPFPLPLSSLYGNGGHVGCVDIVLLRTYPLQWMEKTSDGGVLFRSARAEEREAVRYNGQKQKAMEALYAKIQAEVEQEDNENKPQLRRRTLNHRDIGGLQDGQELHEAVGDDFAGLEAQLSEQQLKTLQAYHGSLIDKRLAEIQDRYRRATEKNAEGGRAGCPPRDVAPVWRLCVADSLNPAGNIYQLSLWRPSQDLLASLKEGRRYKVYHLATSERKKRGGVAAALQLTATKSTQFQDLQTSPEFLSTCFQPRVSTDFVALQNLDFDPLCGEVDLTGCVVRVIDGQGASPSFYLVDCNMNFVKVRCFNSLLQAGLADVVKPNALLALSNLQLRGQSSRPTPVVYAGDLAVFSTSPKEEHLQRGLGPLRDQLREQENFFLRAEEKLSELLQNDSVRSPDVPPKTPHVRTSVPGGYVPAVSLQRNTPRQPVGRWASARGNFRSSDPRRLKRWYAASPPPSLSVRKTFNPPRRTAAPRTLKPVDTLTPASGGPLQEEEEELVNDRELAMIDTQALCASDALLL
ncbi:breast cancer type 2 susceptibility protein isoform X2 [Corythoichthys intestinalis]|uniref:breast cancer type 2 susceptibility protein isoform X2 n=1 Tax=Corythoichthys intestinalis TaxID=161448 RepID=UPI0025A62FFB|nr:breast cancer type 2 susceptibility protein isoform X2 [Corythoichthys intestinalis]